MSPDTDLEVLRVESGKGGRGGDEEIESVTGIEWNSLTKITEI
jgi:hypothetical protein